MSTDGSVEGRDSWGWGFVGPGGIARAYAEALELVPGGELVAVTSRRLERAARFAAEVRPGGDVTAYDDVAAMVADPRVDVVYVATPHPQHLAPALAAIGAGKAVVVEKPMTASAAATARLVATAAERGVFCMEAYWTRFLPATAALLEVVGSGAIGEVRMIHADLGFPAPSSLRRFHEVELGGGSLLDLGPYPLGLAHELLGAPDRVRALGTITADGLDEQVSIALGWPGGALAALSTTMVAQAARGAWIEGTAGWIEAHAPLYSLSGFTVRDHDGRADRYEHAVATGHRFLVEHVHDCLAAGLTESPHVPGQRSIDLARVMDDVLTQIGAARPDDGS
ncbi:Gfo/Idh/MocA family protein [Kineococcus gynurae]|uniref:Gfo/Idh/MocA family protein n=1 Tax=Kineococcus gynurae TaxID=452979 RepID=A0ABV5LNY6_9ACTN